MTPKNLFIALTALTIYALSVTILLAWIAHSAGLYAWGSDSQTAPAGLNDHLINLSLILAFGLQHSVMARASFKRRLIKITGSTLERSVYLLATCFVMGLIMLTWQHYPGEIWSVEHPILRASMWGVFLAGWTYMFLATWAINHFELMGLRNVFYRLKGMPAPALPFQIRYMYRYNRHPIQTGILLGTWCVPTMSVDHFLIAIGLTVYIFIGLYFEERDLNRTFGQSYADYQKQVGGLIPRRTRPRDQAE